MARNFGGVAKAKVRALLAGSTAISVPAQNFARLAFHNCHGMVIRSPWATAQAKTHDFAKQIGSFLYHGVLRKMIKSANVFITYSDFLFVQLCHLV